MIFGGYTGLPKRQNNFRQLTLGRRKSLDADSKVIFGGFPPWLSKPLGPPKS
jgi:hypothetical protein